MKDWRETIVKFYVFATLVLMPLYYENGYFNTLRAKAHIFWVTAGVVLLIALIVESAGIITRQTVLRGAREILSNFNLMDYSVAGFGLVATLSWLFSDYRAEAFTGSNGWNIGAGTIILLVAVYFYVSRNFRIESRVFAFILTAATILFTLGVLNGLSLDPLGLHTNLAEDELYEYIATIGNVNSYAGYLSLIMPVIMGLFIISFTTWQRVWSGIVITLGFISMFMGNSDGAFLGVGFGSLFLVTVSLHKEWKYVRLLHCGVFFGIAAFVCKLFEALWPGEMVDFLGVPEFVLNTNIYILIFAVCIIFIIRYKYYEHYLTKKTMNYIARIFAIFALAAVAAVVASTAVSFDGSWGTKRGYIWQFAVSVFADGSIKDKLIGVGPDCFGIPVMNAFSDFIEEHWGKRIANAHNEYLQYLVTTGILGAVSYIMIYVSSFYDYIKKKHWCEEKGIWLFGIMGYAGQAVVNNPQALNMATLFLFLAIYRSFSYMQQMQEAADRQKARLETDLRHRDNEH